MNRERRLDSYVRELRFDVPGFLRSKRTWLDLCCGQGRALADAAELLPNLTLVGLDLVDFFHPDVPTNVQLIVGSASDFQPEQRFDLITCVHGLHYVGDKLGLLERALGWLNAEGLLLAHLDLKHVRLGSRSAGPAFLRQLGLDYHPRFRLVSARGPRRLSSGWRFIGADNGAGPNFTGQPAVSSHYQRAGP